MMCYFDEFFLKVIIFLSPSGCPGSERMIASNLGLTRHLSHVAEEEHCTSSIEGTEKRFHTITDLSSDEKIDAEIAQLKENLSLSTTTPRGSNAVWAQQIEKEVVELRNLYEDHREEMMSILGHEKKLVSMTSTGCSPIDFLPMPPKGDSHSASLSSPRKARRNKSRAQFLVSESEDDQDCRLLSNLQRERRQEFEKFKKKKMKLKAAAQPKSQPKFAIGQPVQDVSISALFPQVKQVSQLTEELDEGRHVATVDGDQVFIPKLNLEDQWSIEDACSQTVTQEKLIQSRRKRTKKQDLQAFFQNLHLANETAGQLKQRSQALLSQLQKELDNMVY